MSNRYDSSGESVSSPATRATPVTPNDTDALGNIPKALYIGTGGTLVMRGVGESADATWRNVPDGALIPFRAQYVRATGTSAADILGLD